MPAGEAAGEPGGRRAPSPRVSYQAMLDGPGAAGAGRRFVTLGEGAIATRRRDAKAGLSVKVSKGQLRWLRDVEREAGGAVDAGAVVRALIDLGAELDVDWGLVQGGADLREAVRRAVLVQRPARAGGA